MECFSSNFEIILELFYNFLIIVALGINACVDEETFVLISTHSSFLYAAMFPYQD